MIKTQDLKLQMDELTKQNDMVLIELESVKKMLMSSSQGSQDTQGQQQASSSNGNNAQQESAMNGSQSQGQDQDNGQNQSQAQSQNQDQGQQTSNGQNNNQDQSQQMKAGQGNAGNSNNQQVTDLANELLKIKDLVVKLEQKTSQYVSSQSNGSLTEKDAVNLVLTLMNGMVDWASEFVSSKASSNGQVQ
ncbi:hypothetical protein [Paenibacillus qinlingensis]|uniref:DNA polymerase III gamma/tau subunit n=1 Tax=Paenibacillus qinlingensis TaxID=1837343 RepID=A0ABU1NVE8_9BACL|nr:hypothetical protein [Paenibacillus qinlingensis]MDR6551442.1 DNA polymerase III gamma/tau subunit [Paenibacillus qinlingensis]